MDASQPGGPSQPRVAYMLSPALLRAADALPASAGRSRLVHALAWHCGLITTQAPAADAGPDAQPAGAGSTSEERELVRLLAGDTDAADSAVVTQQQAPAAALRIPPMGKRSDLLAYHTASFVDVLLREDPSAGGEEEGLDEDTPRFAELRTYALALAGAAVDAAKALRSGSFDVALLWDGGRHHARRARASGFCYVSDAVLAMLTMRKPVPKPKAIASAPGKRRTDDDASLPQKAPRLGFGARPEDIRRAAEAAAAVTSDEASGASEQSQRAASDAAPEPAPAPRRWERILYLDIDLHWGDGVEEAWYNSPSVLTLSVHHWAKGFFPAGGSERAPRSARAESPSTDDEESSDNGAQHEAAAGSLHAPTGPAAAPAHALNLPLLPGAGDATLARVWDSCVEPAVKAYAPDAVVLQCGTDALYGDPCGVHNLSLAAYVRAVQAARAWKLPTLVLGGGGYTPADHARTAAAVTAAVLDRWSDDAEDGQCLSRQTEVPLHDLWPAYAQRPQLDVPAGSAKDENDEAWLTEVEAVFAQHAEKLRAFHGL